MITITKLNLKHRSFFVNALLFRDHQLDNSKKVAIFTHGYTAHKGQLVTWAQKLASSKIPTIIFDLPGHYLGSFNEVEHFNEFKNHVHELFFVARNELPAAPQLILGGHSLGAWLSLKALTDPHFKDVETLNICVGLGLPDPKKPHPFKSPFYLETMELYSQLVSPALSVTAVLEWIYESRNEVPLMNRKIHLLCGEDDFIVGNLGAERLQELLTRSGNHVDLLKLKHLPHNNPEMAGAAVRSIALG